MKFLSLSSSSRNKKKTRMGLFWYLNNSMNDNVLFKRNSIDFFWMRSTRLDPSISIYFNYIDIDADTYIWIIERRIPHNCKNAAKKYHVHRSTETQKLMKWKEFNFQFDCAHWLRSVDESSNNDGLNQSDSNKTN